MSNLWDGRFEKGISDIMKEFNASIDFDQKLAVFDIVGSIAYAGALLKADVITSAEHKSIVSGLKQIEKEITAGEFEFSKEYEDIHMNIEARLTNIIGSAAKKLHTGRSRNEQVVLDEKLYVRAWNAEIKNVLLKFIKNLISLAENNIDYIMPGFTHLQPAQPILFSHYILAYCFKLKRSVQRLDNCAALLNESPIGVGAIAGSVYAVDRKELASELGFSEVSQNSIDAVSSRDFITDFLAALSIIAVDLSQFAEDFIIFSTPQFAFIELPDEYSTGSSLMPQKKNPDALELIRGKTAAVISSLTRILILLKGLPIAYDKDLQEDKLPLFESVENMFLSLSILTDFVLKVKINKKQMLEAAKNGYLEATDIADYLVAKNVPFRDAHHIAGKLVKYAITRKKAFSQLTLQEFKNIHPSFENDIFDFISLENIVARRNNIGGTSLESVQNQILYFEDWFDSISGGELS